MGKQFEAYLPPATPYRAKCQGASYSFQQTSEGDQEVEVPFGLHPGIELSFVNERGAEGQASLARESQQLLPDFVHNA